MKKQVYMMIAILLLVGSTAVAGRAQNNGRTKLTATIPFQFRVGQDVLPAGDYLVTAFSDESPYVILKIQSRSGRLGPFLQTLRIEGRGKQAPRLVFNRYDDEYFLSQVWSGIDRYGLRTWKFDTERRVAREFKATKRAAEPVVVAARQ